VSQRAIEMIVGRLVTDEAFRRAFERDPRHTLEQMLAEGFSLTETEIRALIGTRPGLWSEMGDQIDPHLQKADLGSGEKDRPSLLRTEPRFRQTRGAA